MNNLLSMSTLMASNIPTWMETLITAMKNVVNPVLVVAAVVGIVYAIWVGIKFIKADDKNEREEAKQKLIYVIIGIVVTGVLIALFYWLAWALENNKIDFNNWYLTDSVSPTSKTGVSGAIDFLKTYLNAKL